MSRGKRVVGGRSGKRVAARAASPRPRRRAASARRLLGGLWLSHTPRAPCRRPHHRAGVCLRCGETGHMAREARPRARRGQHHRLLARNLRGSANDNGEATVGGENAHTTAKQHGAGRADKAPSGDTGQVAPVPCRWRQREVRRVETL
ncbi:hypothetical protein QYE76_072069 [Lolium multiflorum]|uniref:CCHC-type domain-containing protein n=1 Tax=Lolium multiflorum TaxID=4521 RepID=A0AAD8PHI6_LOLMU|nr:hypothetical protein QYE76_072069 [Lolium multiflorum]